MKLWIRYKISLVALVINVASGLSQDELKKYIPLPPQELTIEQYLYHIEDVTPLTLSYSTAIIEDKRIAIYSDSILLQNLLDTLFTPGSINYLLRGDNLLLSPSRTLQKHPTHYLITGEIVNKRNDKSIPYATVSVPGRSTGTISNFEGNFKISIPISEEVDSLQISCLGYAQKNISLDNLLTGTGIIRLEPNRFQIDELIVRPQDPNSLIRGMLENKPENYSTQAEMLTAFFRETATQDENYISLSEAVIDIYKTDYRTESEDKIRLVKGRRGNNVENPELVNLVVEGSLYNNIRLDVMKYGISFLDPEFFENYEYEFKRQVTYNERATYVIGFKYLNNIDLPGFNGVIYLDVETLGLVRAEFEISAESLLHAYGLLIKRTPPGFRIQPRVAKYEVEYRKYNDTWNLNYARSEVVFRVKKKRGREHKGYNCLLASYSEFVITGKSEESIERIRYREASKPGDILYRQITETDAEFWGTQNIIIPEEPLTRTIQKLRLNNLKVEGNIVNSSPDQ